MNKGFNQPKIREAVGIFDHADELEEAFDELLSFSFDRAEMSLLAGEQAVEEKLGHIYTRTSELADDPNAPRIAFVSEHSIHKKEPFLIGGLFFIGAATAAGAVVASGGALAAVITAAGAAGAVSGMIGAFREYVTEIDHAHYLHDQLEHGGLLLWVRIRDAQREQLALDILSKHSAHDVHIHDIPSVES